MKKALYVATVDVHIRTFHLPYLKMLHDNGYEVHVATNGDEKFPNCDVKHQICIERSPFNIKNIKAIKQLKKIIEKEKFDIIHCHTPMGSVVTRLAARKARKKYHTRVIYTAHGFHFYKGAPILNWILFYPIEKWLAKYTDTLITINKEDYELAKNKFSRRCNDIKYVPGVGVDTEKFNIKMTEEEKTNLKKTIGLKEKDYVLTCVARLDKNKNQGFLIQVMKNLVEKHPNIHLLLVGPDELHGYYQEMTEEKGINDNVHFLGRRSDIPELLQITDIVVSASKREGLPVNIIEALASSTPVVALECRGMKDLIEDGKNGYVIDDTEKEFENVIEDVIIKTQRFESNENVNVKKYSIINVKRKIGEIYFNSKKRVIHVLNTNMFSGAENVAITIINETKKDYDITYISKDGPIRKYLDENSIRFEPIKKTSYTEIKKVIKKCRPDIIHAHDFTTSVICAFATKRGKIISHIHNNAPWIKKVCIKSIIYIISSIKFSKILLVSDSIINEYIFGKFIKNKSVIIGNPIDTEKIIKKSKEYETSEEFDLIYLGRLSLEKNPIRFIEVVKEVSLNTPIKAVIVGDGLLYNKCVEKIKKEKLENTIVMKGFIKNPYPVLANSKVLCITSNWEGYGLAAVEALTLGKPVVATNVGGLVNIIDESYGKIIINNSEAAEEIIKLLKNAEYYNVKSNGALNYSKKMNNKSAYIKIIYDIYSI